MKLTNWNNKYRLRQRLRKAMGIHSETIIQDVDVPIARAPEFLDFFQREIGLTPLWTCPFKSFRPQNRFPFFDIARNTQYVNFGFWDAKTTNKAFADGHFNRLIEDKIFELGGTKSLYADNYFTQQQFHDRYSGDEYARLKAKYDPQGRLADLYRKCVLHE
jgi:FAD/FMN-containing dehydrogenase